MAVTREGLEGLSSKEDVRLAHLHSLSDKNRSTETALRNWLNAMNWRVGAHYFYLPIILFIVATGWSLVVLLWPLLDQFL
jgi:hypothetical protein